ncbi:MAG: DUF6798 domain-containing protein [Chloroflexota bacterium]
MFQRFSLRSLSFFLFWSLLFSIAYTQYPLFSSNQNTYFLPGFACAGIGNLTSDWQANTHDPAPLFSALVCFTLRFLRWHAVFYLYYALILGIYFQTFFKLVQFQLDLSSRTIRLVILAAIFLLHAAGTRFLLGHLLGPEWSYVLEGGLANQRLLGSVFQPSVFGVFLLLSIRFAIENRYQSAVICLAVAAWFHPTYLLPGSILMLTILTLIWQENHPRHSPITLSSFKPLMPLLALFLILITPVVFYVLLTFASVPAEISRQAAEILVRVRIPHHADPRVWFNLTSLFQLGILIGAIFIVRHKKIKRLLLLPLLVGSLLSVTQILTRSHSLALLFPWRISVVLFPLAMSVWLAGFGKKLLSLVTKLSSSSLASWLLPASSTAVITICVLVGWLRFTLDLQRFYSAPEWPLYHYVQDHLSPQDIYLIPPKMEYFRLSAGAAAYVDFKSSPYQAAEVIEWYRRLSRVNQFYSSPTCAVLRSFQQENVTHLVLPKSTSLTCSFLTPEFETDSYLLYKLQALPVK